MPLPLPLPLIAAAAFVPFAATAVVALGLAASISVIRPINSPAATGPRRKLPYAMDELSQLRRELAPDVCQETIWNKAESCCWETIGIERRRLNAQYEAMLDLLRQPGSDLRALLGPLNALQAEKQRLSADRVDRWATVYDSLNDEQKEKARLFCKQKLEQALADGQQIGAPANF